MDIDQLLSVLKEYGINPDAEKEIESTAEVGDINPDDQIETISINEISKQLNSDNESLIRNFQNSPESIELKIEMDVLENENYRRSRKESYISDLKNKRWDKDSHIPCAWYQPAHYFGSSMGIYIRQECLPRIARNIMLFSKGTLHGVPRASTLADHFQFAALIYLFLHEQHHHKVESLGFRALIATGFDKYRPYKTHVYRKTFWTDDCLEESLANAESYRRLTERKYKKALHPVAWEALRNYLVATMPFGPPGYRRGIDYFDNSNYRKGIYLQQCLMIHGKLLPSGGFKTSPLPHHWGIAPYMNKALFDISDEVYFVVPSGSRSIFPPKGSPGYTTSTKEMVKALTKHYGFSQTSGGKGSHIKLENASGEIVTVPGCRKDLSSGVLKSILASVGKSSLNKLPDFLNGSLS